MQRLQAYLQQFMPDMRVLKASTLRSYIGLITFSAASLAIALGITLSKILVFEYHSNSDIVGWLSVNEYPKRQEYFYYLLALLGVPTVIWLYWVGWCVYSHWCAKLTAQSIQRVLKANALASIPLWLCWIQVYHTGQQILIGLLLPIGLSVLLKLGLLSRRYFPTLWNSDIPTDSSTDEDEVRNLTSEEAGEIRAGGYRLARVWWIGFVYVILPVFIYLLTYSGNIHKEIDLFHEGERLAPLDEMLRGGVPFRDIYIQHGVFQTPIWHGLLVSFLSQLYGVYVQWKAYWAHSVMSRSIYSVYRYSAVDFSPPLSVYLLPLERNSGYPHDIASVDEFCLCCEFSYARSKHTDG